MVLKLVSGAVLAAVLGASAAEAQSLGKLGGPSDMPPAGFTGQQYVDGRGCVFLKAGYGGQTSWVPRVGRDRKALCGYPPTFGAKPAIEVATAAEMAAPAAQPEPQVAAAPVVKTPVVMDQPIVLAAPKPKPLETQIYVPKVAAAQPAPYAAAAPKGTYEVAQNAGPSAGQIGCYTSAPVAERVKLRNGGTAVVCTRGDGTLTGWRPPVYPNGAGVGASLSDPVQVARGSNGAGQGGYVADYAPDYAEAARDEIPAPPKGYKLAWNDDRLNPNRGKGTAQGQAEQDQVWTRKVPSELVADQPKTRKKTTASTKSAAKGSRVTTSTKGQATENLAAPKKKMKAAAGGVYVQVGTFGVPANAEGAASRLSGMGLPVARSKITSGGKPMQIVLAGPFGSANDAAAALSMARGAGFGDAFLR